MKAKISLTALVVMLCLGASGLACKRDDPPPASRSAAPSQESVQRMLDPALPPGHPPVDPHAGLAGPHTGQMPSVPPPTAPAAGEALAWDLPSGWTEVRGGGMRFATLKPPVSGKVEVSVVVLGGTAGGELGNVNRWRGQVGLPPVDEAAAAKMRQEIRSKAGKVSLYDFTGGASDKQRMLAGLLILEGRSWFLKMTGDPSAVEAARPGFTKILESLRPPAEK